MDEQEQVLLLSGTDRTKPEQPPWWFPVGGEVESDETHAEAAVRETLEETGLMIGDPGPVVFTRSFIWEFEGQAYDQEELFYFVRVPRFIPTPTVWTDIEAATIRGLRWWSVEELRTTDEEVFPEHLAEHLQRLLDR